MAVRDKPVTMDCASATGLTCVETTGTCAGTTGFQKCAHKHTRMPAYDSFGSVHDISDVLEQGDTSMPEGVGLNIIAGGCGCQTASTRGWANGKYNAPDTNPDASARLLLIYILYLKYCAADPSIFRTCSGTDSSCTGERSFVSL